MGWSARTFPAGWRPKIGPMSRPLAAAAWSVRTGPLRIWPGRAICRGQVILARLGDAAAVRRRLLLVWSAHPQVRLRVTTGRPSQ